MASRQLHLVMRHLRRAVTPVSAGLSDGQLLARFLASRDEAAFELLVRRHERMVLGLLHRVLRDSHAVENAFQATFLILARRASTIAKDGSIGAWLYRVGYRVALRARANAGRQTRREQPVEHVPETPIEESPEDALCRRELSVVLDDELNRLPEKYRTPLVLCYLEGRSYRAAAEELHSSVGTISTWLTRGRELLRQRLARRGVGLSACLLTVLLGRSAASAAASINLIDATLHSATLFAANAGATAASAEVLTLTQGVLKAMFFAKLKTTAALLAAVTCAGLFVGTVAHQTAVGQPAAGGLATQGATPDGKDRASDDQTAWRETRTIQAGGPSGPVVVLSLAVSPDGKLLCAGTDARILKVWEIATGKEVSVQGDPAHKDSVLSVRFSPDGTLIASGSEDATARLWEVSTASESKNPVVRGTTLCVGHSGAVSSVAFSPDGSFLASGSADKSLRVWHVQTGRECFRSESGDWVSGVAFSPDGKLLLSGSSDGTVRLWDAGTGKELRRANHTAPVRSEAFSPDGRLIAAAGGDDTIRLWDVVTGQEIRSLKPGRGTRRVTFSPDGKSLAAAASGPAVIVIDVSTGKVIVELRGHKEAIHSVTFAPDGRRLFTGDASGAIKVWEVAGAIDPRAAAKQALLSGSSIIVNDRLDELMRRLAGSSRSTEQLVEAVFLATLARLPTESESKFAGDNLAKKGRLEGLRDLLFALTNTKEFTTNLETLNSRNPWRQLKDPRNP